MQVVEYFSLLKFDFIWIRTWQRNRNWNPWEFFDVYMIDLSCLPFTWLQTKWFELFLLLLRLVSSLYTKSVGKRSKIDELNRDEEEKKNTHKRVQMRNSLSSRARRVDFSTSHMIYLSEWLVCALQKFLAVLLLDKHSAASEQK